MAGERGHVEALRLAAGDEHDRRVGVEGGESGVRIRRFRVVDEPDTVRLVDDPTAMGGGDEGSGRLGDGLRRRSDVEGGDGGEEHVEDEDGVGNGEVTERDLHTGRTDHAPVEPDRATAEAHRRDSAGSVSGDPGRPRIVSVDDKEVTGALVLDDASLCRLVRGEVHVPVEMVGSDVGDHGHPDGERVDEAELEARELDDENVGLDPDEIAEGRSDVPHRRRPEARSGEHVRHQRRHGRLPVCPRHPDERCREVPEGELDLAPEGDPPGERVTNGRARLAEAGARHDEVSPGEDPRRPRAGDDVTPLDLCGDGVVHGDLVTESAGKTGGGDSREGGAEDEHVHGTSPPEPMKSP